MSWNVACVASVCVRFRSKEWGTRDKDRAKNGASKRAGRGGGGEKGRKRLLTNPSILKTAHLAYHAWVHALTFDAVNSCHNWPIKCWSFRGAEMNFRGESVKPNYFFFVFWNAWTALMVKSQWIRTINAGQSSSRQYGLPFLATAKFNILKMFSILKARVFY